MCPHLSSWHWASVLQRFVLFTISLFSPSQLRHLSIFHPQDPRDCATSVTSHSSNWALRKRFLQNVCFMLFSFLFSGALQAAGSVSVPADLVGHTDFLAVLPLLLLVCSHPHPPATTIPRPQLRTLRSMRTVKTRPSRKGSRLSTNPWLNSWPGCCRRAVRPQADRLTKRPVRGCSSPPLPRPPLDPSPGPLLPGPPPPPGPGPGPGPGPAPEPPLPPDPAAIAAETAAARQPRLAAPWQPRRTDALGEYGRGLGPAVLYGTARTEASSAEEQGLSRGERKDDGVGGLALRHGGMRARAARRDRRIWLAFATANGRNARRGRICDGGVLAPKYTLRRRGAQGPALVGKRRVKVVPLPQGIGASFHTALSKVI